MEQLLKNFPKTSEALENLRQNIALLEENTENLAGEKEELSKKLSTLQTQLAEKAASIDAIIETLNGVIK